jgi:ABC-type nitrate/sulfonate/bicarbonate transport system substrate-binding protein
VPELDSPPTMLANVARGSLQVVGIAITPGFFSSVERGIEIKLVGTKTTGFSALRFVVSNELAKADTTKGLDHLKGKKIAITSKASSNYYLLEEILRSRGLGLDDVNVVEMGFPSMPGGLSTGAIDAAIMFEPFISQTVEKQLGTVASGFDGLVPGGGVAWLVYSEKFASDRKKAKAFMRAYVKAIRIYNDAFFKQKDYDRIVEVIAKGGDVPASVIKSSISALIDPNQGYDDSYLKGAQRFFLEQKYLEKPTSIENLVDWSFASEAVAELGKY